MNDDNKVRDEGAPAEQREPYEPPAVVSEEIFETLAIACGKPSGPGCLPGRGHQLLSHEAVRIDLLRDLVNRTGGAWVTCIGSSMEPTIRRGTRLRVASAGRPRPGDVVLFEAGASQLVTHRVLARFPAPGGAYLVHSGDAGGLPGLVREARVLGRVQTRRRTIPLISQLLAAGSAVTRALRQRVASTML